MRRIFWVLVFLLSIVGKVAAETRVPVVVIEYPPFISESEPGFGLSFNILSQQLEPLGLQTEAIFLPAARALQRVQEAESWLFSFYPPVNNPHTEQLVLQAADIRYSLFRRHRDEPFRWQHPRELGGGALVTTRQSPGNEDLAYFQQAGLEILYVNHIEQGFQMLLSGRADYLLGAEETGRYYLRKLNASPEALQFAETLVRSYPHTVYINNRHPLAAEVKKKLRP